MNTKANYLSTLQNREVIFEKFRDFLGTSAKKNGSLIASAPYRFSATKSLAVKRAYYTRLAYKQGVKIAAVSLLFPPEICWAAGYVPFNWEMFSSLLATHSRVIELANSGSAPVPRCSFINSLKGSFYNGILPAPDILVSSSAFCEGISHIFGEIANENNLKHLHADIPGYLNNGNVKNLAAQMTELFREMCSMSGISVADGTRNLRRVMLYSSLAKNEFLEICKLRKIHAPLNLGLEPFHWHFLFTSIWGEESGYTIVKRLKEEIIKEIVHQKNSKPDDEALPFSVFSLIPYGNTDIWEKLIASKAYTTFEGVNFIGEYTSPELDKINQMSLDALMLNLSYNLINTPMRGLNIMNKSSEFMQNAKDSGAKGILIFTHEHCQMLSTRLDEIEKSATAKGLKFACVSGDCILGMPKGPANIRLGTFLSSLKNKKTGIPLDSSVTTKKIRSNKMRIGIDFGSGFSKYVMVDENDNLIKYDVVNSGIDYPGLLAEIKKKFINGYEADIAIAGVGGDNPLIKDYVTVQTTEINALIQAIKNLCNLDNELTVIDIGTQDVKVIKFNGTNETPWVNTNKSCGAGTGMVLVQILERWQQTKPEIAFSDLDRMASEAVREELINTTCGIFAVTNVVSALVQSDEEKRKDILRGVYQYIAEQAVKLLPAADKKGGRMLLTGGLANHSTLRSIFCERGFELISFPKNLHPQFLVAYGTALSI